MAVPRLGRRAVRLSEAWFARLLVAPAIVAIAAVGGGQQLQACTPCGGCRQRIAEFSDRNTRIILLDETGQTRSYTVEQLLPASFRLF